MSDNPLLVEALEEKGQDLEELPESSEFCPRCQYPLHVISSNNSPDNFTTGLICPNCQYFQQD